MKLCISRLSAKSSLQYRSEWVRATALLLAALLNCPPLPAQEQRTERSYPSDLGKENLNRVAASPAQVEEVLRKEPGLLLELKRWVAKEASNSGRIVDDTDLTDRAIYDRLSRDLTFRAVATRLLQRYGYLVPKLNPESEEARERDLLLQARVRQLMQETAPKPEEEATKSKAPGKDLEQTPPRDSRGDRRCSDAERQARQRPCDAITTTTRSQTESMVPELRGRGAY